MHVTACERAALSHRTLEEIVRSSANLSGREKGQNKRSEAQNGSINGVIFAGLLTGGRQIGAPQTTGECFLAICTCMCNAAVAANLKPLCLPLLIINKGHNWQVTSLPTADDKQVFDKSCAINNATFARKQQWRSDTDSL